MESALLTDLYQLTMLQAYHREGMAETAVFELFVRKLPPTRNFLVAAGLEQLLEYLQKLRFSDAECAWLSGTGWFTAEFIDSLAKLRFRGDVDAMPEGTVFFPDEPIVRVTAALPEAQLVETRLINLLQFQTMIASKAVRGTLAAPDKFLVEFGLRRAHGYEAGLLGARASYLAGFSGTSNVLAGQAFGIPIFGTMAHSYIMAHALEVDAFREFARALPGNLVLLIDTYDTLEAAQKLVALAPELAAEGISVHSVRLDSGDLAELAFATRRILDGGGLSSCRIFASGDLDEYGLLKLMDARAPIDGFGVGTRVATSQDAPYLNCAYKMQEYAGRPRRKRSQGKATWPGRKQVFRHCDRGGILTGDVLALASEPLDGEPLLQPVLRQGERIAPPEPLEAARRRLAEQLQRLPPELKAIDRSAAYPVQVHQSLRRMVEEMERESH